MNMTQPPAQPFKLFISYSHRNEACKDRLKTNLAPLVRNKWVELWDDRAIPAGADWRQHIEDAMQTADAAVFLIDDDFLASDFCMDVEIATFLQNHRELGTLIIFVITDHCGWQDFDFISRFKVIPLDGRPITAHKPYSKAYTHIKDEIRNSLAAHQPKPPPIDEFPLVPAAFALGGAIDAVTAFDDLRLSHIPAGKTSPPLSRGALLERLPGRSSHLFGREDELTKLDTWRHHKGVFLWIADGGMGKSTLTRWWLEKQDWPEGTRFLGHSFYRQGSRNEAASARGFLIEALANLHIEHAENAPDEELGRKLAEEIAKAPTVLVLDGIEPTQQAAEASPHHGSIRDPGLATLIGTLARQPGQALCLATSRIPVTDTMIRNAPGFREEVLHTLLPAAALALLRQRGIAGSDTELGAMAERCGHQPLALVLAAEFSHTFLQGKAPAFLERPWQPKAGDTHAVTVMGWFDQALAEEHQALDRELSLILGLFDRPAPWGALMALKAYEPAIPGLTERLHKADDAAIFESLARLSQWGLLQTDLTQAEPELDAHPLVREHFGKQLKGSSIETWQAAHSVLFKYFSKLPEKHLPDTLEELEPLYRAIRHGCQARRWHEAAEDIFVNRILRGTGADGYYSVRKLGSFGANLGAIGCFFSRPWRHPTRDLPEHIQAWLMNTAAYHLRAMGRLNEALMPMHVGARMRVRQKAWKSAAIVYCNLSELQLSLGKIPIAIKYAQRGINYASLSDSAFQRIASLTTLADALHQQGRINEAFAKFAEAELLQEKRQPEFGSLYSLGGFQLCTLLLAAAERAAWGGPRDGTETRQCKSVMERALLMLKWEEAMAGTPILDIALHHITLARSDICNAKLQGLPPSKFAEKETEKAIGGLYSSGNEDEIPRGLLTRSWLRHSLGSLHGAKADLDEAQQIAERGSMKLYLADIALTRARLFKDRGELAKARALIEECGYGRRLPELADAEAAAKDWPA